MKDEFTNPLILLEISKNKKMKNNINTAIAAFTLSVLFVFVGPIVVLADSPAVINLGTAGNFVILSKAGVSTTGATSVVGDIGVSPITSTAITGFALTLPATGSFSTSALVTGTIYASDYANPTPTNLTTAILDMQNAYTDGMGRAAGVTELGAGNIGGLTLASGVYKWGTGLTIPTDVTLSGGANDVWIFQVAQNLNVSSGVHIVLSGGAQASNIFWVVAGQTTIDTTAVFNGNILDQTAIVLNTGATLNGRALAQTAVTLDSNVVTKPSPSPVATPSPVGSGSQASTPPITPTPSPSTTGSGSQTSSSGTTLSSANVVALQAQLTGLLSTAQALQAQIAQRNSMSAGVSSSSFGQLVKNIAVNLGKGSRGSDVTILQEFLISQNKGSGARALASVGATGYFGELTRSALAEFQANVGVSPALGNFGSITRGYISTH